VIVEAKIAQSQSEVTPDQSTSAALGHLRSWDKARAYIDLRVTGPDDTNLKLVVRITNITASLVAFEWQLDTLDSPGKRSFEHSDGVTVISLEDATVALSDDPQPSLTISRGAYTCKLTVRL
jgi:hypothetical protein